MLVSVFTAGEAQWKKSIVSCNSCHGARGNSVIPIYPNLAGQNEKYFVKQMLAFKNNQRNNAIMQVLASKLSEQDINDLAKFYAELSPAEGNAKPEFVATGQHLYRGGDGGKKLPACMACHGPAGEGNMLAGFPRLAAQQAEYLQTQLINYKKDARNNQIMQDIAKRLTDEDIIALASYIQGLHPSQ